MSEEINLDSVVAAVFMHCESRRFEEPDPDLVERPTT